MSVRLAATRRVAIVTPAASDAAASEALLETAARLNLAVTRIAAEALESTDCDAIVFAAAIEDDTIARLRRRGLPFLVTGEAAPPPVGLASDCYIGGRGDKNESWALRSLAAAWRWPATLLLYGEGRDRLVELRLPEGSPRGVLLVLHGGFWREPLRRDMTAGLAIGLAQRGFVTLNAEYRRIGASGGGAARTVEDVLAATAFTAKLCEARGWDRSRTAIVGHSAGGHLALLAASHLSRTGVPRAVVALAPVTDMERAAEERLGADAVRELLDGADPAPLSPIRRLPLGVPQLIIHGDGDRTVPIDHSRRYVDEARRAGDDVSLRVLPGVGHMPPTHPDSDGGRAALDAIDAWLATAWNQR